LIPTHAADQAKTKTLVEFIGWVLDHGEAEAAALTYAPLPKQVSDMVRKSIATIK
jgi:phosphate transport system substrate-binding protein